MGANDRTEEVSVLDKNQVKEFLKKFPKISHVSKGTCRIVFMVHDRMELRRGIILVGVLV